MSFPYATLAEFTQVYCFNGVSPTAIQSYWLFHGSGRVNESFGHMYTTPFSSNNWTAKDLTIHFAALGIFIRTLKTDDSEELQEDIERRVSAITSGDHYMTLEDGVSIKPDKDQSSEAWSETMNYKPTFDMREPEFQVIDCDRLQDEWDADDCTY